MIFRTSYCAATLMITLIGLSFSTNVSKPYAVRTKSLCDITFASGLGPDIS